jgi:hypothetical protein
MFIYIYIYIYIGWNQWHKWTIKHGWKVSHGQNWPNGEITFMVKTIVHIYLLIFWMYLEFMVMFEINFKVALA